MSDDRLRLELISLGFTPGPITENTRGVLEKKLEKLRAESRLRNKTRRSEETVRRSGETPWSSGETVRRSGETPWSSGETVRRSRETPWSSGETVRRSRETPWSSGETVRRSRETPWSSGETVRRSGETVGRSGETVRRSGETPWSSGETVGRSGVGVRGWQGYRRDDCEEADEDRWETDRSGGLHRRPRGNPEQGVSQGWVTPQPEGNWRADSGLSPGRWSRASSAGEGLVRGSARYNGYSGEELRVSAAAGDSSRDRYRYDQPDAAVDRLSHKQKDGHQKPRWARNLEYYLSRVLWVLSAALALVFINIIIVKSGVLSTQQGNSLKLLPSDCEHKDDPFCKTKQKQITFQMLSELYDFLSLEAGRFECGNPSGLSSKCVPINRAKEHVMNVSGYASENFDAALDWLLNTDRHLGIWAKGENAEETVTARTDVFCFESSRPRLRITCRLKNALYTAICNLFLALLGIFILWMVLVFMRYHWKRLEEEEKQMFEMVEKIIDIVKGHYKNWTQGIEQNAYVGIPHVRDTLIMPQNRKHLKKVWDRAVRFVDDNESRLRTESQRVAGADLRVWRWTQTK